MAVFACYFEKEIKKYVFEIYKFLEFIHENNPLLLQYYDYDDEYLDSYCSDEKEKEEEEKKVDLYENKYLTRFKNFTNEYLFDEKDFEY